MSLGEIIVILVVALFVFGPDKLPTLAQHAATLFNKLQALKMRFHSEVDDIFKQQQYEENLRKAEATERAAKKDTS